MRLTIILEGIEAESLNLHDALAYLNLWASLPHSVINPEIVVNGEKYPLYESIATIIVMIYRGSE